MMVLRLLLCLSLGAGRSVVAAGPQASLAASATGPQSQSPSSPPSPSSAEARSSAAILTLAEAQAEARRHAPQVAALRARVRGAAGIADVAGRIIHTDPEVAGRWAPPGVVESGGASDWQVGLRWRLDVAGTWGPAGRAARASAHQATWTQQGGLRALDEAVAVAVADLAMAQSQLHRAGQIAALFGVASAAAREQLQVGQGNRLDADAARLDWDAAKADLEMARGARRTAQARLAQLLGRAQWTDLQVADPHETVPVRAATAQGPATTADAPTDLDAAVAADPRVRAAAAALAAARSSAALSRRRVWPSPTLGVTYGVHGYEIPAGRLAGAAPTGRPLSWTEPELGFELSFPLPLFNRRSVERARARARTLSAAAHLVTVRAAVREQWLGRRAELDAARRAYEAVADTPALLAQEMGLVQQAVQAGSLGAVARAQALRRLTTAGRRYDRAVHALRLARARWRRLTGP